MFTNVKKFGSYVLTSENCFSAELQITEPLFISECSVPPVWTDLTLTSTRQYNHDTNIFTFRLPEGCQKLNLPVGGFLLVLVPTETHSANFTNGSVVSGTIRPYTSIADDNILNIGCTTGHFELLCKRYDQWGKEETTQTHFLFTKTNHSFRPPGIVSNYIHKLKIGETLKFKRK
jgi:hypothetical protein